MTAIKRQCLLLSETAAQQLYPILDRLRLGERFPRVYGSVQLQTARLYGPAAAMEKARLFICRVLAGMIGIVVGGLLLSLFGGMVWMKIAAGLILLLPLYAYKNLKQRVTMKQRKILLELPELLASITLLVQAGETVQQAIHRCAAEGEEDNPLREELRRLSRELRDQRPFGPALEDFSKRCGVREISLFSTTVLLNVKRGGSEFVMALQELSGTMWERRKALAKTIGEEASSKLVFPMVVLFLTVMVIVAAPAILMMGGP